MSKLCWKFGCAKPVTKGRMCEEHNARWKAHKKQFSNQLFRRKDRLNRYVASKV